MASKRLKKKQAKREREQLLTQSNVFSKKEVKQLARSDTETIKKSIKQKTKQVKTDTRNERAKRVYHSLVSEGVDPKQARKMRYYSQEKIDAFLQNRRREYIEKNRPKPEKKKRKQAAGTGKTLLIFWKDKVDYSTDPDDFFVMTDALRYVINDFLILEGRALLQENGGAIGNYQIFATDDPKGYKAFYGGTERGFYSEWICVYEGKASPRRYHELLVKIIGVLSALYYQQEKMSFMMDLIRAVHEVNPTTAKKLQQDFQIQFI